MSRKLPTPAPAGAMKPPAPPPFRPMECERVREEHLRAYQYDAAFHALVTTLATLLLSKRYGLDDLEAALELARRVAEVRRGPR